ASAALFLCTLPPAVAIATRRELPTVVRTLALVAAGVLAQFAVLAQSRGSIPAIVIAVAVLVAMTPDRRRCLIVLGLIAATTLACLNFLLEVYAALDQRAFAQAIGHERVALAVSCVWLAGVGVTFCGLDRRRV